MTNAWDGKATQTEPSRLDEMVADRVNQIVLIIAPCATHVAKTRAVKRATGSLNHIAKCGFSPNDVTYNVIPVHAQRQASSRNRGMT